LDEWKALPGDRGYFADRDDRRPDLPEVLLNPAEVGTGDGKENVDMGPRAGAEALSLMAKELSAHTGSLLRAREVETERAIGVPTSGVDVAWLA